jgi:LacI family transcriptional regulator
MGALEALDSAAIRVPREISIVGYDDIVTSHSARVALTTVAQPSVEMGRTAVNLLIERSEEGRDTPRHIVMAPRLVVRGTTAGPSA